MGPPEHAVTVLVMHAGAEAFADLMAAVRDAASQTPYRRPRPAGRIREPLVTHFADHAKVFAERARQANGGWIGIHLQDPRRVTEKDRLVYDIQQDAIIIIIACRFQYDDH